MVAFFVCYSWKQNFPNSLSTYDSHEIPWETSLHRLLHNFSKKSSMHVYICNLCSFGSDGDLRMKCRNKSWMQNVTHAIYGALTLIPLLPYDSPGKNHFSVPGKYERNKFHIRLSNYTRFSKKYYFALMCVNAFTFFWTVCGCQGEFELTKWILPQNIFRKYCKHLPCHWRAINCGCSLINSSNFHSYPIWKLNRNFQFLVNEYSWLLRFFV